MSELFEDLDQQRAAGDERDAEALVRQALELIENAKQMPLSASVLISKEEVAELLHAALQRMPDELRQARWLLKEREDFIAEKSREADVLLEEVRVQAERMVQRTEIVRQANHVAQRILDDANEEARRLRHEVEDYADQKLASFEIVLDRTMKTVRAGREKLQVSPIPPVEIGEQGDTSLAPSFASTGGARCAGHGRPGRARSGRGRGPRRLLRPGPRLSRMEPVRSAPHRHPVPPAPAPDRCRPVRRAHRSAHPGPSSSRRPSSAGWRERSGTSSDRLPSTTWPRWGRRFPRALPVTVEVTLSSYPGRGDGLGHGRGTVDR